ncbi:MAG: PIN domain-containing protein [Gammaproteobacteria bacterium]
MLLDTNVLVYAYDRRDASRRDAAIALLRVLVHVGDVAVSAQVLGEFFWTVSRNIPDPLTAAQAGEEVRRHARTWQVVSLSSETVRAAAQAAVRYGLPYWDALIWAAAKLAGIPVVLSEDFQDGREIEGVTFQNPFLVAATATGAPLRQ